MEVLSKNLLTKEKNYKSKLKKYLETRKLVRATNNSFKFKNKNIVY